MLHQPYLINYQQIIDSYWPNIFQNMSGRGRRVDVRIAYTVAYLLRWAPSCPLFPSHTPTTISSLALSRMADCWVCIFLSSLWNSKSLWLFLASGRCAIDSCHFGHHHTHDHCHWPSPLHLLPLQRSRWSAYWCTGSVVFWELRVDGAALVGVHPTLGAAPGAITRAASRAAERNLMLAEFKACPRMLDW